MKKYVASFLLVLLILLSLLTSCSTNTNTDLPINSTISQQEITDATTGNKTDNSDAYQPQPNEGETSTPDSLITNNSGHNSDSQISDPSLKPEVSSSASESFSLNDVPAYSGTAYVVINGNVPYFDIDSLSSTSYESYSPLDSLDRCGVAYACIGQDIMPTEERGSIGQVKPSGWHTVKYDVVDGKYLYNRCHLIGYQLSAENANTSNLITGTRYMNIQGMLPFENMTADYVKETGNHVAYRVTPAFEANNLLASGVLMEGYSVEDKGEGVSFCVFVYNVQPGIVIDYTTGDSKLADETHVATAEPTPTPSAGTNAEIKEVAYILNTNTKKFHYPSCSSVGQMKESNKKEYTGNRDDLINQGYEPCKRCNP